ncbi:unnamed protein product [Echinostoma caproni]|uniref:Uncharacterized protein n=1 Tax=Echinostoma caproni TaxID=27848 RepID=A0A183A9C5_9TREM|nr:unnamed protein product [Echinostoma caproni]
MTVETMFISAEVIHCFGALLIKERLGRLAGRWIELDGGIWELMDGGVGCSLCCGGHGIDVRGGDIDNCSGGIVCGVGGVSDGSGSGGDGDGGHGRRRADPDHGGAVSCNVGFIAGDDD